MCKQKRYCSQIKEVTGSTHFYSCPLLCHHSHFLSTVALTTCQFAILLLLIFLLSPGKPRQRFSPFNSSDPTAQSVLGSPGRSPSIIFFFNLCVHAPISFPSLSLTPLGEVPSLLVTRESPASLSERRSRSLPLERGGRNNLCPQHPGLLSSKSPIVIYFVIPGWVTINIFINGANVSRSTSPFPLFIGKEEFILLETLGGRSGQKLRQKL